MICYKTVLVWSRLDIFVDCGQNKILQYFRVMGREVRYADTKFLRRCACQVTVLG